MNIFKLELTTIFDEFSHSEHVTEETEILYGNKEVISKLKEFRIEFSQYEHFNRLKTVNEVLSPKTRGYNTLVYSAMESDGTRYSLSVRFIGKSNKPLGKDKFANIEDFGDNGNFLSDHYDIMNVMIVEGKAYAIALFNLWLDNSYDNMPSGLYVKIENGDYAEIWATDDNQPYSIFSEYIRIK